MKISAACLMYMRQAINHQARHTRCPRVHNVSEILHKSRNHQIFNGNRPFQRRYASNNPADEEGWISPLDSPPQLVSTRRKHGPGLIVLALIPITAFALGSWQVQRLGWKTELIARFEDRLVQEPLPLPPHIDQSVVKDFDYRRVYATGHFRHDQEMLVGPRTHDGAPGFQVITPLEREDGEKILVSRGWISKEKQSQASRREGLPRGLVTIAGLLREPFKRNMFTPANNPEKGEFYFPDIGQMADLTGSVPVWMEETMQPDLLMALDREAKGVPIGRPAEVNLRNNHTQYIFTWYSLALATTVMFYMVVKRPPKGGASRVRRSVEW